MTLEKIINLYEFALEQYYISVTCLSILNRMVPTQNWPVSQYLAIRWNIWQWR
jgi:hypothetical protein